MKRSLIEIPFEDGTKRRQWIRMLRNGVGINRVWQFYSVTHTNSGWAFVTNLRKNEAYKVASMWIKLANWSRYQSKDEFPKGLQRRGNVLRAQIAKIYGV